MQTSLFISKTAYKGSLDDSGCDQCRSPMNRVTIMGVLNISLLLTYFPNRLRVVIGMILP